LNSDKPTVRLPLRLVSVDGGENFKPSFAMSGEELERLWPVLFQSMEANARRQTERIIAPENRKTFLATYLGIASSHLVIDGSSAGEAHR
jgi:hypothetical protein